MKGAVFREIILDTLYRKYIIMLCRYACTNYNPLKDRKPRSSADKQLIAPMFCSGEIYVSLFPKKLSQ